MEVVNERLPDTHGLLAEHIRRYYPHCVVERRPRRQRRKMEPIVDERQLALPGVEPRMEVR